MTETELQILDSILRNPFKNADNLTEKEKEVLNKYAQIPVDSLPF